MTELPEQDEEFLEDISSLPEERKNGIVAYVKNKCEAVKQENKEFLEKVRKRVLSEPTSFCLNCKMLWAGLVFECQRCLGKHTDSYDNKIEHFIDYKDVIAVLGGGKE